MKFHEECGIFGGITVYDNVASIIQNGLFMLQHRGQESAGMCCGENEFGIFKGKGLVLEVLNDSVIQNIEGKIGIGHVRYSTQGGSDCVHAQPFMLKYLDEKVAIAHNGNVKSAIAMREKLEIAGEIFISSSDTEMILKKVARDLRKSPSKWGFFEVGKILEFNFLGGAWSVLFSMPGKVMAFRDPLGFRPLFFCEAEEGYFVASEDSAFRQLEQKRIIEIEPGEGVEITLDGYKIQRFADKRPSKKCVFEHIYFSRPDSNVFGRNVYMTRIELGKKCAQENPVDADVVIPVMDSGFAAAMGYSHESGIPLHMGLLRNHWVGRTFIQPEQKIRQHNVQRKQMPITPIIADKKVILVDDSLVRGTTSKELVKMLRKAGAKEVHIRIASPMVVNTCVWGVDIPTKKELFADAYDDINEMSKFIEADSLAYLTFEGMIDIFGETGWCYNCFEGEKQLSSAKKELYSSSSI